jgi:hypothetical protein
MDRAALLSRCEDAYRGIRDARGMNAVITAVERAEDALGALILALEPGDIETRATVVRLADFRDLSRSMRRIS